jgi:hypothetical protein
VRRLRLRQTIACVFVAVLFALSSSPTALAEQSTDAELNEIKAMLEQQRKTIRAMERRIQEMEADQAAPEAAVPPPAAAKPDPGEAPSPAEDAEAKMRKEDAHRVARVKYRHMMNDRQLSAGRASDYTLTPQYRGFIPVPNTVFAIKFNAKPRVDFVGDTGNPGTDFRFVPAKFPANESNGWQFSGNANGSQLRLDIKAPEQPGNFRFYYQNDFFGSNDSNMNYRLQHLYGQYYGFLGGFTYGVFEDPDAWPDTVDYEGPNSVIFSRRALFHYKVELSDEWQLTLAMEDPDIFVDTTGDVGADQRSRAPDTGFNIRWVPGDLGHVQFSSIYRSIAVNGDTFSNDDVFGWGLNTAGSLNITSKDTLQFWFVYGEGIGGMGNDTSFEDSDAAFNSSGDLEALEYWSTMVALTHRWAPRWRSTATHGYVNLENVGSQDADAYHASHYASLNLMYQVYKRLSIGVEGLYGWKEVNDGRDTDLFRFQLGLAYSLFD